MNHARFEPGPLADVHADTTDDGFTVVFVKELRHPPATVWAALTEPRQLERWAPYSADRDLGRAGPAALTMLGVSSPEPAPIEVTRAEPPDVLVHTWGDDVLHWELTPIPTGTRLLLRHTVQGPDWGPKVAAGWHLCLVVLDRQLGGEPVEPIRGEAALDYGWAELRDAYAARIGGG